MTRITPILRLRARLSRGGASGARTLASTGPGQPERRSPGRRVVSCTVLATIVTVGMSVAMLGAPARPAGADTVAPGFGSPTTSVTTFAGNPFVDVVQANGSPTPTLSLSGSAPAGSTFADNGNGTGTFRWTPSVDIITTEDDTFTVTATNAQGSATLTVTVVVNPALQILGPTAYTVADGDPLELGWDVDNSVPGFPTLTESGVLPAGLTFTTTGHGESSLAGTTSTDGSADGVYPITITASNGIAPEMTKTTIVTVEPPSPVSFTSAPSLTVQVGTPFTFTVTLGGAPTESIWDGRANSRIMFPTNPFPPGVNFQDNGDGTGTISGTVQDAGQYPGEFITFYPFPGFPRPSPDLHTQCRVAGPGLVHECGVGDRVGR